MRPRGLSMTSCSCILSSSIPMQSQSTSPNMCPTFWIKSQTMKWILPCPWRPELNWSSSSCDMNTCTLWLMQYLWFSKNVLESLRPVLCAWHSHSKYYITFYLGYTSYSIICCLRESKVNKGNVQKQQDVLVHSILCNFFVMFMGLLIQGKCQIYLF